MMRRNMKISRLYTTWLRDEIARDLVEPRALGGGARK
jgi:hypothetical protein